MYVTNFCNISVRNEHGTMVETFKVPKHRQALPPKVFASLAPHYASRTNTI